MLFCCIFLSDLSGVVYPEFSASSASQVENDIFFSTGWLLKIHCENISGNADWMLLTVISLNCFTYLEGSLKIWLDDFVTSELRSSWNFYPLASKASLQWLGPLNNSDSSWIGYRKLFQLLNKLCYNYMSETRRSNFGRLIQMAMTCNLINHLVFVTVLFLMSGMSL